MSITDNNTVNNVADVQWPGYVFIYKNENDRVVIYFYKGLEYNELDLSEINVPYEIEYISDGAVKLLFLTDISYIKCKLVKTDGSYEYIRYKSN